jgi:3-deoxy-manno-octulosonate cytidylyltransferase (CMP-KDO synthetase)
MPETAIIVPCRLESSRFPRKLLHEIHGVPLILWVARRIHTQTPEFPLCFAVDDPLLAAPLEAEGFKTLITRADHNSGTDRLAEANQSIGADLVINVQADEPLVTAEQIRSLAALITTDVAMATLATPFKRVVDFYDANQVKVVMRRDGRALYFSRSRMPFPRDLGLTIEDDWVEEHPCRKHLGLYAYKADLLARFASLPPGELEQIEKLEQLRVLENGYEIAVGLTDQPSLGIDTPKDVQRFEAMLPPTGDAV